MTSTKPIAALENLNHQWEKKGHPYAVPGDAGWTMTCSSCSIAVGEDKISLVDAMSQAIRHRQQCETISR